MATSEPRVVLGVSCDYTRELVQRALPDCNIILRPKQVVLEEDEEKGALSSPVVVQATEEEIAWENVAVQWDEFERLELARVLGGKLIGNCYPVRKGLIRKAQLAFNLRKYSSKHADSILNKAVPETHMLEVYDPEYLEEALCDVPEIRDMEAGTEVWIIKASMVNQAGQIHLIDSVDKLQKVVEENEEIREWVCQRYIANPLLIGGRKFHLRAYVLAVGSMAVYLYEDILALFATDQYDLADLDNRTAHITNTCAQKGHDAFEEDKAVFELQELVGRPSNVKRGTASSDEKEPSPVVTREDVDHILAAMRKIVADTFAAVHAEPTVFLPLPHCFEYFGLDFLVDDTLNVSILEVNASPDFAQTGARLKHIPAGVVQGAVELAVRPRLFPSASSSSGSAGAEERKAIEDGNAASPTSAPAPGSVPAPPQEHGRYRLVYNKRSSEGAFQSAMTLQ